jgi:hypothetical protein
LGRFDRQQTGGSELASTLEAAAAELRSSVERQVHEIVEAAAQRAGQIEREAAEKAAAVERQSRQRANGTLREELGRAWAILGGMDELETRVTEVIGALRAEMETLVRDLEARVEHEPEPLHGALARGDIRARPLVRSG